MLFEPSVFFWQLMVCTLVVFCALSFVIGFNSREKSFLLYSNYTFFLLAYFIIMSPYEAQWLESIRSSSFSSLKWYLQVIYNCSYFIFFLYFLDIKQHLKQFYKFITKVVSIAFLISTLFLIYTIYVDNTRLYDIFYIYVFVPIVFCFAVYTLYKAFKLPGSLKYFFILGGGTFITLAMIALFFPIMGWNFLNINPFILFYIGIFIEQIVFAIGLAYKINLINTQLINKSIENHNIKANQNRLLEDQLKKQEKEILELTANAEKERLETIKAKFEEQIHHLHLVSLQSQMNPHFIFNALNSIKVFLIEDQKEKAVYYLNKFSKLIRHILNSTELDSITLDEELTITKLYASLENIRFEEKIELQIRKPNDINLSTIMVPPMILQPFIENAIWHGLMLKKEDKLIDISFEKTENKVVLKIKDNGIGREKSEHYSSRKLRQKEPIGLKINKQRLQHFNQKHGLNYTFKIDDLKNKYNEATGTEVILELKYK
ncbi:sensor histidine kinase [Psychroflexus halocasei]|uniref:7TM diverse intracellular signalling n=1 Tax=Psychroflexus halocasei TaxID=908615 RepID=A0A1H4AF47_9FLAO|nr:histidine kinase [Psychroflexus halocasei]SEA34703.1 7TM diverse intracellular signalling [Psychroflexus halocasei]